MAVIDPASLYSETLFGLAANIPHIGRLAQPTGTATRHSKMCGSRITVDIVANHGVLTDFAQDVQACLLGQTAASIVGREVIGSTAAELVALRETMHAMLKNGGNPPSGRWADLAVLAAARDYPARHASTLLIFDALYDALATAR